MDHESVLSGMQQVTISAQSVLVRGVSMDEQLSQDKNGNVKDEGTTKVKKSETLKRSLLKKSNNSIPRPPHVKDEGERPAEDDDIEDYEKAFALLDGDNKGEITKSDLEHFIKTHLGEDTTETELQEMITEVDVDGNGSVNFTEFLKLMKDDTVDPDGEKDMLEAFLVFDTDRNGFISADVLRHVMMNIGESLTFEESQDFINLIDADGDGLINYQELVKILSN